MVFKSACPIIVVCLLVVSLNAEVTVTGAVNPPDPANWDSSTHLMVGLYDEPWFGDASQVDITNGSQVVTGSSYIGGTNFDAEVNVEGDSSSWQVDDVISVGLTNPELWFTTGALNIKDGANVYGRGVNVRGSSSKVTISGQGSLLDVDFVGVSTFTSTNSLSIENGGTLRSLSTSLFGDAGSSEMFVSGSGSLLETAEFDSDSLYHSCLNIYGGGAVNSIDTNFNKISVSVAGSTSSLVCRDLDIQDDSYLGISDGAKVSCKYTYTEYVSVSVSGAGSIWENETLEVGLFNTTITISDQALVSVSSWMSMIDGGIINMKEQGALAVFGMADSSLDDFFQLIQCGGTVNYWDEDLSAWISLADGSYGDDYVLNYHSDGDLAGYTILTVPEPASLCLLAAGGVMVLRRERVLKPHLIKLYN